MSADVARGHGGNGGGDDRPPPHQIADGCRGKGTQKPNLGGRMHTRNETRNLGLRKIMDELCPQPIRFECKDNNTMLPLSDHSSHWANLLGEIVREFLMHFGSWRSIPAERKAGVLGKIVTQFDLKPHMQFELWPEIRNDIDQHLGKIYTDNKSSLNRDYWVKNLDDETYNVEAIRSRYAELRDSRVPVPIQTFFDTHTVGGVFLRDEDRRLYIKEMLRLQGLGSYTDYQIMVMVRGDKQRGHILGVGRVLAGRGKDFLGVPMPRCNHTSDVNELKRNNKQLQKQIDMITKAMSSDDRMSQLFTQLQSQHESGSGSGSGAGGDDESGDDEDADEDEEDADS
ncbi:hypothetical protein Tco_1383217 [Tanacetum coccineum]